MSKPRIITVTAELSLRRSEGGAGDRFELRASFGLVRLLLASLDHQGFAGLVTGKTLALPVEVPAWGGSLFSEES